MNGIVGTAGHIDHGKTALIGALTGDETDRLPEEKERGISIDLGFSHMAIDGGRLGIVDVPGHEDFIRNMLAGATGIDVLLLVVAADEGVMPQTREHTAIAELLGIPRAVVALTKVDLVDDDWLGLVHDDLADFLADTPFAGAPVVPTSATTAEGIDELRAAIEDVFEGSRGRTDDLFRLPVDRAFTVRGTGTVVTGTVWSGRLARDASVRLLPDGPEARVRGLQVHGGPVDTVEAGERAAIALAGADRQDVVRGMTVVSDEGWEPAHMLTVRLRVVPATDWSIEAMQRVRIHLGTAEVMARVALLDGRDILRPGDEGWAQLRLESPLLARAGDRFVARSYSPVTTIGGGVVVESTAPRRTRLADHEAARMAALIEEPGAAAVARIIETASLAGTPIPSLAVRSGATPAEVERALEDAVVVGDLAFTDAALDAARRALLAAVDRHHQDRHLETGIEPEALRRAAGDAAPALVEHALAQLLQEGSLQGRRGRLARAGWEPDLSDHEAALRERIAETVASAGAEPPRVDELVDRLGVAGADAVSRLLELLEVDGRVTRLEHDLFIDSATLRRIIDEIRTRFAGRNGLAPGDFRDVIDVSRRYLMPLLAHLDREEITVRSDEGRSVPGD